MAARQLVDQRHGADPLRLAQSFVRERADRFRVGGFWLLLEVRFEESDGLMHCPGLVVNNAEIAQVVRVVRLDLAHALDHLFLLIFATAVAAIATDFGLEVRSQRTSTLLGATVVRFGIPDGRAVATVLATIGTGIADFVIDTIKELIA